MVTQVIAVWEKWFVPGQMTGWPGGKLERTENSAQITQNLMEPLFGVCLYYVWYISVD